MYQPTKLTPMSGNKKYEDIRLEVADNGFILRYCECEKRPESGTYDVSYNREYKEYVYPDEKLDEAIAKMKLLREGNK
jgi:hypothetical protein